MIKKKWKLLMLVVFFLFMIIIFSACLNAIVTPGTEENTSEETHTCTNGLCLDYYLTLEEDASNRPHMVVNISNIQDKKYINLAVSWPLVDDSGSVEADLFNMINNISVKDKNDNFLNFEFSEKNITCSNWYLSCKNQPIYYDTIKIDTDGNNQIIVEYDLASNIEIWTGLGGNIENPRDCEYFWTVYLENILYRPEEHQLIEAAYLNIDVPSGWDFATVYPKYGNTVELGTMDYMYGDNIRWVNYQRGGLILFKDGPFILESENVYGVEVQDVYSREYSNRCCEANSQYFEYLCDHIGVLPVYGVLTFAPFLDGNKVQSLGKFTGSPYAWYHGLMGEYCAAGGDLSFGSGAELPKVPLWDIYSFSEEKSYSFKMHGVVRYWIFMFIQIDSWSEDWFKGGICTYYENMAVSSRYGYQQIKERRFKPMYEFYKENADNLESCNGYCDFISYFKPALVAFYINELLTEQSNGEICFDNAMKIIFDNALMGDPITKYSFIDALNSLTDYDFTNIVNDYIYGNDKVLDLDKYFY
jgi:hypothetical protein